MNFIFCRLNSVVVWLELWNMNVVDWWIGVCRVLVVGFGCVFV